MKRLYWVILITFLVLPLNAQRIADYGFFGGISYYTGDINPGRYFYAPSPSAGLFYRVNIHPRHSLRWNLYYGGIQGNDLDFDNAFQQERGQSFRANLYEMGMQFEFNFLPYTTTGKWWDYSPYFATGLALTFSDSPELTYTPVIPLTLGFKLNIFKNTGLELEYSFRKTFYDNFDGLTDNINPDHRTWTHNNDWYMFAGVSVTWKMFHTMIQCPAYDEWRDKRNPY